VGWRKHYKKAGPAAGVALIAAVLAWAFFLRPVSRKQGNVLAVAQGNEPAGDLDRAFQHDDADTSDGPGERNASHAEEVSGDVQLARHFRSVIAGGGTGLGLTPQEVNRLVADLLEFQEIHADLVGRYAQETHYDPTSTTVHVPPFPVEGKALRDLFHQRLKTDFPEEKFERIDAELGNYIEMTFHGFGIADQTFVITKSTEQADAFEIEAEIKVPGENASTAPNPDAVYSGGSDKLMATRQQLDSGEYRFLGRIVERRFPKE
jgi:hypothetical protein